MKKLFLLLTLVATCAFAQAPTWEFLFKDPKLGSVYYSPKTIGFDELDRILVWLKTENNGKGDTVRVLYAVDCRTKRLATPAYKVYNRKGKLMDERNESSITAQYSSPDPDSLGGMLVQELCPK